MDATDPSLREGLPIHRIGHPRDDPTRARARRGQSRPGIPRLRVSARAEGGGLGGDPRRHQPVRDHLGRQGLPRGDRRQDGALLPGLVGRSADLDHRRLRRDRGNDRVDARAARPGRRGDRLRAVLRELRSRRGAEWRGAALRDAARAGLVDRLRRAARRVRPADARPGAQLAAQPDRQGVHARRARGDRGAVHRARRDRLHRRHLRAHPVRGHAHPDGHDRRHGRRGRWRSTRSPRPTRSPAGASAG